MTVRRISGGKTALMGIVVASLAGSAVLPSGQVVSVVEMDASLDDDHGALDEQPVPTPPPAELVGLMDRVVALQMQKLIAPDGNVYLVLGAVLRTEDDGFTCRAILHRYGANPPCVEVLEWARQ